MILKYDTIILFYNPGYTRTPAACGIIVLCDLRVVNRWRTWNHDASPGSESPSDGQSDRVTTLVINTQAGSHGLDCSRSGESWTRVREREDSHSFCQVELRFKSESKRYSGYK